MRDEFSSKTIRNESTFCENETEGEVNKNILRYEHGNEKEKEKEKKIAESEACFFG
jgi:hypothetical protein